MSDKEKKPEIIQICTGFREYTLLSDNEGQCRFWSELMKELENNIYSVLCFNVPIRSGAEAYFTNTTGYRTMFDTICCPEKTAKVDTVKKTVKFNSSKDMAIFVHECSHWRHLVRDNGVCQAKGIAGKVYQSNDVAVSHRRDIEYEAGWRAIVTDNLYQMFEPRISLELNIMNMFNYDKRNLDKEKQEAFAEIFDDMDNETYKALFYEHIASRVLKFGEWADPEHEIIGIDELIAAGRKLAKKD